MRFVQLPRATFSAQVEAAGIATEAVPLDIETASAAQLHNLPIVKKLQDKYSGIKVNRLPKQMFSLDFERDIIPAEEKLINDYGFMKEEISFIMRYNPKFILVGNLQQSDSFGIKALKNFLVD
jgi:hypothetical protein